VTAPAPAGIPRVGRPLLTVPAALLAGFLALALGLLAAGYDPVLALGALWRGGLGSTDAIVSATLVRAVPLIVLGLGVALAFRAGALNIGAEGQFYAGAIAATWVGLHAAGWPAPLAIGGVLLAGLIAGALWIALPVLLKLRFGVLEVISTLLLNFVAEAAVSWAVTGPLREARGVYPQSDPIALGARLPRLEGTRLHAGIVVPLALAAVLWLLFTRTRWGFRLRAVGLGPRAAAVSGRIPVGRVVAGALLWSGALAGLGGGLEIAGVTWALFQNLSPGYGFTAIAVALLARLHPIGIVGTGLLFGALEAGAQGMQREAGVPAVAVAVVEAAIILVVLLAEVAARRALARGGPGRGAGGGPGNWPGPARPGDLLLPSGPGSPGRARPSDPSPPSGSASRFARIQATSSRRRRPLPGRRRVRATCSCSRGPFFGRQRRRATTARCRSQRPGRRRVRATSPCRRSQRPGRRRVWAPSSHRRLHGLPCRRRPRRLRGWRRVPPSR
jgi:simple sugar transport system permease protein